MVQAVHDKMISSPSLNVTPSYLLVSKVRKYLVSQLCSSVLRISSKIRSDTVQVVERLPWITFVKGSCKRASDRAQLCFESPSNCQCNSLKVEKFANVLVQ
jgi:hypothetical protein